MQQIFGTIERITFFNPDNCFTVAKIQEPRKRELTTIVGTIAEIKPGESVSCYGQWKVAPQHGMQFAIEKVIIVQPQDVVAIQKYLASGMIRGIGPAFAEKIITVFGIETLNIIDKNPDKLLTIEGIGEKKLESIISCWQTQKAVRELMVFFQQFDVTPSLATKVYKRWGEKTIEIVQQNPYRMAQEIRGIGFKTADKIAERMGISKDHPLRVDAALIHQLFEISSEGHSCFPEKDLIKLVHTLIELSEDLIKERIEILVKAKEIIKDLDLLYHPILYASEMGIVRELVRIKTMPTITREFDGRKALIWVQEDLNIVLAEHQQEAVLAALKEKMLIITGGPGTGKSTITKAILTISRHITRRILLAAPTGRAAKRMSEITGFEARTIHSLLEWSFANNGFKRNAENLLECDIIIIDEASMIDTFLMYGLLKAIPSTARLILIGDINQIPSVGPGNILKDIINSNFLPTFCLTEIFRQAKGSHIITNAHRINAGEFPELGGHDFFFVKEEDAEKLALEIVDLVKNRLPKRYQFNRINDIQVIVPMKKGVVGIENLNFLLQEALNPSEEPLMVSGRRFHLKDKVMQLSNDYQKEVYNGDIGRIVKIDAVDQQVLVCFDERIVPYDYTECDSLTLAYAVSVHKYQGSEAPCIVMPVHTSHFMLLQRNLLYTAVTRGRKLVVLAGSAKAIHIAIGNNRVSERHTGLKEKLNNNATRR